MSSKQSKETALSDLKEVNLSDPSGNPPATEDEENPTELHHAFCGQGAKSIIDNSVEIPATTGVAKCFAVLVSKVVVVIVAPGIQQELVSL